MTRGDNEIVVVRKGEKGAVKTPDGWQSFEELQSNNQGGQGQGRGRVAGVVAHHHEHVALPHLHRTERAQRQIRGGQ